MVELGTIEITVIKDTMVMRMSCKNHVTIFFSMRVFFFLRNIEQNILDNIYISQHLFCMFLL